MRRPSQPVWQSLAALFAMFVVLAAGGYAYTNHVQREADHRWCELIATLDEGYGSNPQQPTTPRGMKLRDDIHRLRKDLGC